MFKKNPSIDEVIERYSSIISTRAWFELDFFDNDALESFIKEMERDQFIIYLCKMLDIMRAETENSDSFLILDDLYENIREGDYQKLFVVDSPIIKKMIQDPNEKLKPLQKVIFNAFFEGDFNFSIDNPLRIGLSLVYEIILFRIKELDGEA